MVAYFFLLVFSRIELSWSLFRVEIEYLSDKDGSFHLPHFSSLCLCQGPFSNNKKSPCFPRLFVAQCKRFIYPPTSKSIHKEKKKKSAEGEKWKTADKSNTDPTKKKKVLPVVDRPLCIVLNDIRELICQSRQCFCHSFVFAFNCVIVRRSTCCLGWESNKVCRWKPWLATKRKKRHLGTQAVVWWIKVRLSLPTFRAD